MIEREIHRSPCAAVWMPRVLAAAVLAAGTSAVLQEPGRLGIAGGLRALVWIAAAGTAVWIWRGGRDARAGVTLRRDCLVFGGGARRLELPAADLEGVDLEPAFASLGRWFPAVILVDRFGRRWRLPVTLERAEELVERFIEAAGRDDVRAWYGARAVARRLRRQRWIVPLGYVCAAGLIVAGLLRAIG